MRFADRFLYDLAHRCVKVCRKTLPAIQFPVFKKFLMCRVRRELQYYRSYCDLASILVAAGADLSEGDIDELIEDSRDLDRCLRKDITLLPVRIHFDYDRILPVRRKRAKKQILLFMRLLSADTTGDYRSLARKALKRREFLQLHNELMELYADETLIINSSLRSLFAVNSEAIAEGMDQVIRDIGIRMNRETADRIFGEGSPAL